MKRIVVLVVLVALLVLALGAVALAGSSSVDAPDLANVSSSGGGAVAQQVE